MVVVAVLVFVVELEEVTASGELLLLLELVVVVVVLVVLVVTADIELLLLVELVVVVVVVFVALVVTTGIGLLDDDVLVIDNEELLEDMVVDAIDELLEIAREDDVLLVVLGEITDEDKDVLPDIVEGDEVDILDDTAVEEGEDDIAVAEVEEAAEVEGCGELVVVEPVGLEDDDDAAVVAMEELDMEIIVEPEIEAG